MWRYYLHVYIFLLANIMNWTFNVQCKEDKSGRVLHKTLNINLSLFVIVLESHFKEMMAL